MASSLAASDATMHNGSASSHSTQTSPAVRVARDAVPPSLALAACRVMTHALNTATPTVPPLSDHTEGSDTGTADGRLLPQHSPTATLLYVSPCRSVSFAMHPLSLARGRTSTQTPPHEPTAPRDGSGPGPAVETASNTPPTGSNPTALPVGDGVEATTRSAFESEPTFASHQCVRDTNVGEDIGTTTISSSDDPTDDVDVKSRLARHPPPGWPPAGLSDMPCPLLFRDTAAALARQGLWDTTVTTPWSCTVVEAEGPAGGVGWDGTDGTMTVTDGTGSTVTAVVLSCGGDDGGDTVHVHAARDSPSDVSYGPGTAITLSEAGAGVIGPSKGRWLALVFSDFGPPPPPIQAGDATTNQRKPESSREARKREARRHKKAVKAAAQKRALQAEATKAAHDASRMAIVPHGCFKSVPIPWEVVEDACAIVDPRTTPAVERDHVKDLYNAIAQHWHRTRWKAWPKVTEFVTSLPQGSLVGDIGCGNGKNLPACNAVGMGIGCDLSEALVRICRDRGFEVATADAMVLPYRNETFDATLSIAVMHHLSSPLRRVRALAELTRILRTGGQALVYAWAYEQGDAKSGHKFGSQDVFVPWHARDAPKPRGVNVNNGEGKDGEGAGDGEGTAAGKDTSDETTTADVDTADGGDVLQRYCHVYKEGELQELARALPWLEVTDSWYDTGNWAVVLHKVRAVPDDYDQRFQDFVSHLTNETKG
eukprot:m.181433 g.181433  ORF g.181433 m.181433 type:complete len:711 (+) comp15256_c0_seq1:102-2234(+)